MGLMDNDIVEIGCCCGRVLANGMPKETEMALRRDRPSGENLQILASRGLETSGSNGRKLQMTVQSREA